MMKTLYLDCGMGAAGDMLTGALLELIPNQDEFITKMNNLGIPEMAMKKERSMKCGIRGTKITVTIGGEEETVPHHHGHDHDHGHEHDHHHAKTHEQNHLKAHNHHHAGIHEIEHIIKDLRLAAKIELDVLAIYKQIAEAESHVHGIPVVDVHFHEVGAMDAIADITAVCLLMSQIAPEQVIVSPIHVGGGHIRCAHGILPVPAPATMYILHDAPIYGGGIKGELCTPTGAALLKHFATRFGNMPIITTQAIGYGMGKMDFEAANCLRAILGEAEDCTNTSRSSILHEG